MQIASFSLAEVTYAVGGDIGYQVQESVKQARFRVRSKQENVSGVLLPAFESYTDETINDFALTGLGKGGQQVQRCRETYARAVEALVELASLQTAFVILDEVIKVVNRRGECFPVCNLDHQEHSTNLAATVNAMYLRPSPGDLSSLALTRFTASMLLSLAQKTLSNVRCFQCSQSQTHLGTESDVFAKTSTRNWTSWTVRSSTASRRSPTRSNGTRLHRTLR